jgi:hypothetical protein
MRKSLSDVHLYTYELFRGLCIFLGKSYVRLNFKKNSREHHQIERDCMFSFIYSFLYILEYQKFTCK